MIKLVIHYRIFRTLKQPKPDAFRCFTYPCGVFRPLEIMDDRVAIPCRDLLLADPGVPPCIMVREGVPNIFVLLCMIFKKFLSHTFTAAYF